MSKTKAATKKAPKTTAKSAAKSASKSAPKKALEKYHQKRDFTQSPEPTGDAKKPKGAKAKKSLMFCVQKHLASHLHYDFRLEHNGTLLSWAVPKGPSLNPKDKRLAMKVEDHPYDYGDFEGVIPSGYGAGIVMLWDRGTWTPENGDVDAALTKGDLKFTLDGAKLKGSWVIVRTRDERTWLLIKHRDEWAGEISVIDEFPRSVKSDGDFDDILAQEKPDVWESHRPAEGGVAGAMFKEIIDRAAKKKLSRQTKAPTRRNGKKSRAKKS